MLRKLRDLNTISEFLSDQLAELQEANNDGGERTGEGGGLVSIDTTGGRVRATYQPVVLRSSRALTAGGPLDGFGDVSGAPVRGRSAREPGRAGSSPC